jgi:hypothetical protein
VETVERRDDLPNETRKVLVGLLGVLGVESRRWIPDSLQSDLMQSLNPAELTVIAWRLEELVRADPATSAQKWKDAVGPWVVRFWPKERVKRSSDQADAFAHLIIESRGALGEALHTLKPFLVPLRDSRIPYLLANRRQEVLKEKPQEVLKLLDRIVPHQRGEAEPWGFHDLGAVLDAILDYHPQLEGTPLFRRLRDFTLGR